VVYAGVLTERGFRSAYMKPAYSGGRAADHLALTSQDLSIVSAVDKTIGVVVNGRPAVVAVPTWSTCQTDKALAFAAGGLEYNWQRLRMQSCMKLFTDTIAERVPSDIGNVFITAGVTNNPVVYAGLIYGSDFDRLIEYTEFDEMEGDDRSCVVSPLGYTNLKEVVGLAGATA